MALYFAALDGSAHTAAHAVDVFMIASVSASPISAYTASRSVGSVRVSPSRPWLSRKHVPAASSSDSTSHTVAVPTSPPPAPSGLQLSTPGLIFGGLLGGGPFLAWLLRRNDSDAPGKSAYRKAEGELMSELMSGGDAFVGGAQVGGDVSSGFGSLESGVTREPTGFIGVPLSNPLFQTCVYLDYNATTPVYPEVAHAMEPFLWEHFGNPSSGHAFAKSTRHAIDAARLQVAKTINCDPSEVVFTSCGSESDNHAVASAVEYFLQTNKESPNRIPHVVTSSVEHPAILEYLLDGKKKGTLDFTAVPVNEFGTVNPADITAAVTENTCLLTLMHANNEVGAVQPVREAAEAVKNINKNILVHCDAAQSLGKIDVDVQELKVDYLTVVGHKVGAPKGVAATYTRKGSPWCKLLHGGGQESGRRAGTENVVHVVGLGRACALIDEEKEKLPQYMAACTDELRRILETELGEYGGDDTENSSGVRFNGPGDATQRLPNTVSIGIKGISASVLLETLANDVAASAGAACHTGDAAASISGVLVAMDVPETYAVGTLRLSVGRHTTVQDIEKGAGKIVDAVKKQRAEFDAMPEGERPWWCVRNVAKAFKLREEL